MQCGQQMKLSALKGKCSLLTLDYTWFPREKELALQYIREGIYLSLGEKYQEEALRQIPSEYLFLETDESLIDIHSLYERAALLLEMPVCKLMQQVQQNINNVFFRQ